MDTHIAAHDIKLVFLQEAGVFIGQTFFPKRYIVVTQISSVRSMTANNFHLVTNVILKTITDVLYIILTEIYHYCRN